MAVETDPTRGVDAARSTATPGMPDGAAPAGGSEPDLQSEVESILADAVMPIAEKQQRLQDLADRHGVAVLGPSADLDGDGEVSALELQIAEAFGMLAEGGHSYRDDETEVAVAPDAKTPDVEAGA